MKITVSPHILLEPKLKTPRTSDMADIVDAFRRNGLIIKKPGAMMINGNMHVHPEIFRQIQAKMRQTVDNAFIGALRK